MAIMQITDKASNVWDVLRIAIVTDPNIGFIDRLGLFVAPETETVETNVIYMSLAIESVQPLPEPPEE